MIGVLLALVIQLPGVSGSELRARAFFDANNVKVGDPMVLTVDFLGEADFKDLHPPALSRAVNRRDWKLDDASAKTSTYRDARRLTYRVRPMREGVLRFPALEFEYSSARDGASAEKLIVRSNPIPVHAKAGSQVVVKEMGEVEETGFPKPPELIADLNWGSSASGGTDRDELFRWKKALNSPSADAFAKFDAPAARMNEATCAIREGNWARAVKIYRKLEWRLGQTPEIERGLLAALALKADNPSAELPVWRTVLRPVLKYGWKGRAALVLGGFAALVLVLWILGRGIRALACLAALAAFLPLSAGAQGGIFQQFERMEREMEQMRQRMHQQLGGFSMSFGGEEREPTKIVATLSTDRKELQVGEAFEFIISLEAPRTASIGQIGVRPSQSFGLTFTGQAENLPDAKSANPTNVVKRIAIPARYDVPFKGKLSFMIQGMVSEHRRTGGRRGFTSSFSFSSNFQVDTPAIPVEVKPLPSAGQPADFSGIISEGLAIVELPDLLRVETNDVITITYRLRSRGYVPEAYLPKDAAFEWGRDQQNGVIEYKRYFVADGAAATPELAVTYYDPRRKKYASAKCGKTPIKYVINTPLPERGQ